jgi:Zn-dependent alcohol dehydrogenase
MRAALYDDYGPAREVLRVEEIDPPEPGPGEVRVRIEASPHACTRAIGSSVKATSPAALVPLAAAAVGSF